jgi:hypothetical protein
MISIPWVLLGATGSTAIASSRHDLGAVHAGAHADEHREDDRDRCDRDLKDRRSDRDSGSCDCCERAERRMEVTAPGTPAPPGHPAPPQLVRASTVLRSASRPSVEAPRTVAVSPHVPRDGIDQRPPLLAPPALTVPSPAAPATASTTPVAIYVITVSTLLLAAAISIAALVLVRRSD